MQNFDLIATLTGGFAAALILGYVTHRLGLSPIVGYLLAGIVVGPHTPGFVADPHLAEQMSDIGVVLLMFGVGLQFHLEELLSVRGVVVPGALVQSIVATALGMSLAVAFGWDWRAGIVFGLSLSVASTVVLTRVLADNRDLHTRTGHVAVGWLVVEDLYTVLVLVLLPVLFGSREGSIGDLILAIGLAILKISALIAFTFIIGGRVIPRVLDRVAITGSRELFTLTVLVIALGIAVGSAKLFGVSMALGAFLAGMVVGRSDFSLRAATEALPMRDAFAVLFFVSIGMLLDPSHLLKDPAMVAATATFILFWKPIAAFSLMLFLRQPPAVAVRVAIALSQIGEFSFILAALGKQLGIFPEAATNTLVAAAIITITVNPLLYRLADPFEAWASRHPRLWRRLSARSKGQLKPGAVPVSTVDSSHRAVVVGYGPVGRTVTRLLRENEIEPTVVEMNLETVRRLRAEGKPAVYGDAKHRDTLKEAGLATADSLILSSDAMQASGEMIRMARELNPNIRVLARSAYVRDLPALRKAGAQGVFSGEGEIALAMTVAILRELGATPEQIDRERDRVQAELIGKAVEGTVDTGASGS
jgi:CPA2 family monovalent cation:H+ antiporter-2